jgi:hypothetical protein
VQWLQTCIRTWWRPHWAEICSLEEDCELCVCVKSDLIVQTRIDITHQDATLQTLYSLTYLLYMYGFSRTFVYFTWNFYFRLNLYNILNMYLSVCFVFLWLIPHPIVILTCGSMECTLIRMLCLCACVHAYGLYY